MSATSDSQAFDLLESALDQAFSVPPELRHTHTVTTTSSSTSFVQAESSTESSLEGSVLDESWKAEYDAQVQSWRAQSAEAREKAEKERLKWEAIRAMEREEAAKRRAAGYVDHPVVSPAGPSRTTSEIWESVAVISTATTAASSTPAELVDVEPTAAPPPPPAPKTQRTPEELHKWESVSYPEITFPDRLDAPSHPAPRSAPAPVSVSSAIFDSSLSTRTRVVAVFSALAVNLLLPFVNGVMLGFGEIFAKNVVMGWLGWKSPSSYVTNVGLRSAREERRRSL